MFVDGVESQQHHQPETQKQRKRDVEESNNMPERNRKRGKKDKGYGAEDGANHLLLHYITFGHLGGPVHLADYPPLGHVCLSVCVSALAHDT